MCVIFCYYSLLVSLSHKYTERFTTTMILSCANISKTFGADPILSNVSFHINENEKAAIVGANGAGKSTLLKIIMNELTPDSGEVVFAKGTTVGYLAQHQDLSSENTIYDELLSIKKDIIDLDHQIRQMELDMTHLNGEKLEQVLETYSKLTHQFEQKNGYAYRSEIIGVLKGLGFSEEDFEKKNKRAVRWTKKHAFPSESCCFPSRTLFCLMSRPTIWIWNPLHGWKIISSTIMALLLLLHTTVIFLTE